eukprot:3846127-Rhodomonas_salina.4
MNEEVGKLQVIPILGTRYLPVCQCFTHTLSLRPSCAMSLRTSCTSPYARATQYPVLSYGRECTRRGAKRCQKRCATGTRTTSSSAKSRFRADLKSVANHHNVMMMLLAKELHSTWRYCL